MTNGIIFINNIGDILENVNDLFTWCDIKVNGIILFIIKIRIIQVIQKLNLLDSYYIIYTNICRNIDMVYSKFKYIPMPKCEDYI